MGERNKEKDCDMENRVFLLRRGSGSYAEIIRCDVHDGSVYWTIVDRYSGIQCVTDYGYTNISSVAEFCDQYILRFSDIDEDVPLFCIEDINKSILSSKFGSVEDIAEGIFNDRVLSSVQYQRSAVSEFVQGIFSGTSEYAERSSIRLLMDLHKPEPSECGGISLFRCLKDKKRDRRTTMKAGRAFRHMLNSLSDAQIASVTEAYIEWASPRLFTLHTGYKARHFAEAYGGDRASYRNPTTTYSRKSLASSCMQGVGREYMGDEYSVGEAYASGDFFIVWLTDERGLIAGRVVVGYRDSDRSLISGPIYGVCEQSLDMLSEYLKGIHAKAGEWDGLSLQVVGDPYDPIVPYLDGGYSGNKAGDKLLILPEGSGDYEFTDTEGFLVEVGPSCYHCGYTNCFEPYHNNDGDPFCETCFDDLYSYTDGGDLISAADAVIVYYYYEPSNRHLEIVVHVEDSVYVEELDEYWSASCVEYVEEKGEYYPSHLLKSEEDLAA